MSIANNGVTSEESITADSENKESLDSTKDDIDANNNNSDVESESESESDFEPDENEDNESSQVQNKINLSEAHGNVS